MSKQLRDEFYEEERIDLSNADLKKVHDPAWLSEYALWLESKLTWISVEERLPEKYKKVLGTGDYDDIGFIAYWDGDNWHDASKMKPSLSYLYEDEITHWLPLPEPPK